MQIKCCFIDIINSGILIKLRLKEIYARYIVMLKQRSLRMQLCLNLRNRQRKQTKAKRIFIISLKDIYVGIWCDNFFIYKCFSWGYKWCMCLIILSRQISCKCMILLLYNGIIILVMRLHVRIVLVRVKLYVIYLVI